jgi:hypothetical protein
MRVSRNAYCSAFVISREQGRPGFEEKFNKLRRNILEMEAERPS